MRSIVTSLWQCQWEDDIVILCSPGNILKQPRIQPKVFQRSGSCSLSSSATSDQRMCPLIASKQPSCMSRSVLYLVDDGGSLVPRPLSSGGRGPGTRLWWRRKVGFTFLVSLMMVSHYSHIAQHTFSLLTLSLSPSPSFVTMSFLVGFQPALSVSWS